MVKLQKSQGVFLTKQCLSVWPESFPVRARSVNTLYPGNPLSERVEGFLPAKENLNYLYLTRRSKKILWNKAFFRYLNDSVWDSVIYSSATDLSHDLRQVTSPLCLS